MTNLVSLEAAVKQFVVYIEFACPFWIDVFALRVTARGGCLQNKRLLSGGGDIQKIAGHSTKNNITAHKMTKNSLA